MSASQATLLSLTGRLHDVEYKAQNLMNQKVALATQKDALYQEYCDALDAKKIQVAFNHGDGTRQFVDANFSTVCGYDENRFKQYSLTNAKTGKVIVDERTAQMYNAFDRDKYAFAHAMLGLDVNYGWGDDRQEDGAFIGIGTAQDDYGDGQAQNGLYNLYMTEVERKVFDEHQEDTKLVAAFEAIENSEDELDKKKALESFRDLLYDSYAKEIYDYQKMNKQDGYENSSHGDSTIYDSSKEWGACENEFNYYMNLFEQIKNAGGCEVVDPQYVTGEKANEWFNNMVNSGMAIINVYDTDKKEWTETSVATSTNQNYLQEAQDEKDLKKAEAKYEHELDIIKTKDAKFDQDLSKLETERTSITTEMDAIKKVKDDNIDRTFGIFS